ncbi:MAG TPA: RNA-binding protein [Burkholderiales bacterium]|nr:RNA-binding protein [Burkholderiales bacterium]
MNIWIGNLAPGTTEAEVRALLEKYGFPEPTGILAVPGDGMRPGFMLEYEGLHAEGIRQFVDRLDGLYWKGRSIVVSIA